MSSSTDTKAQPRATNAPKALLPKAQSVISDSTSEGDLLIKFANGRLQRVPKSTPGLRAVTGRIERSPAMVDIWSDGTHSVLLVGTRPGKM